MFNSKTETLLKPEFNEIPDKELLRSLSKLIALEGADNMRIDENQKLIIENNWFSLDFNRSNWNIWSGIDRAEIELTFDTAKNSKRLIYTVSFVRFLLITLILSIIMGIVTLKTLSGFGFLLGVLPGGISLLIAYIRHKDHLIDFKSNLDTTFITRQNQ